MGLSNICLYTFSNLLIHQGISTKNFSWSAATYYLLYENNILDKDTTTHNSQ